MEATALTRSASLAARLRRSRTARFLHLSVSAVDGKPRVQPLRRAVSESDLLGSVPATTARRSSLRSPRILEEDEEEVEALGSIDGGIRKGNNSGGSGGGDGAAGGGGGGRMGEYYRRMLRSEPGSPLLLRNYGKYLHEVEGDLAGAEEYYGRALLSSPGDGEMLSLYGRVVWEAHRQKDRAASYYERAVEAEPNDCYVLGSYASFLWDAEEDDEEEEKAAVVASPQLVPAC